MNEVIVKKNECHLCEKVKSIFDGKFVANCFYCNDCIEVYKSTLPDEVIE